MHGLDARIVGTRQAEEFYDLIHSLSRSGGKVDVTGAVTGTTGKKGATKATKAKTAARPRKR